MTPDPSPRSTRIRNQHSGRVYLSRPHLSGLEQAYLEDALASGCIAPLGPHVDGFEEEIAEHLGVGHAVALSSGTAGLHLALRLAGVEAGDEVLVPSFTFIGSVNPVLYLGARPVFVDSEWESWNMDPGLLREVLERRASRGRTPSAVMVVHLYGQAADLDPIAEVCREHGVALIEDAAEALGASYRGRAVGTMGLAGVFSFNGNKIITTSGGGMLVTDRPELAERARSLAAQALDPAPHYQHSTMGYNYRLSNLLAAVGRAQLLVLEDRVAARRANFEFYRERLGDLPGVELQPEAPWGGHTRWLTCITIEPAEFGADREAVRVALEAENIEARPLWKPMHLQPLLAEAEMVGGDVCEELFERGLCLPSGSDLSAEDRERIVDVVCEVGGA